MEASKLRFYLIHQFKILFKILTDIQYGRKYNTITRYELYVSILMKMKYNLD